MQDISSISLFKALLYWNAVATSAAFLFIFTYVYLFTSFIM